MSWEELVPVGWQTESGRIVFAVSDVSIEGGTRIAAREIPYRPGAKLDQTGRRPHKYRLTALFFPQVSEPGLDQGEQMWPDRLNALEAALDTGETGTLDLPWRRSIRAKCETWSRKASAEQRDGEVLEITFCEDNEEDVADEIQQPSVAATLSQEAEATRFDAEAFGAWDGSLADLTELAAGLEGALRAPGEALQNVKSAAKRLQDSARRFADAVTDAAGADGGKGNDPRGAALVARAQLLADQAAAAEAEASASLPATREQTFDVARDLASIATELGQDYRQLLTINTELEDPGYIPKGTPVKVFA